MRAIEKESLPGETLGDRDDLPGVEGVLAAAALAAAALVVLIFVG
jgi:hypothetical protein